MKRLPTRKQFEAYVKVQKKDKYNMLDPRAVVATGLTREVYNAVIENYALLAEKYPQVVEPRK